MLRLPRMLLLTRLNLLLALLLTKRFSLTLIQTKLQLMLRLLPYKPTMLHKTQ